MPAAPFLRAGTIPLTGQLLTTQDPSECFFHLIKTGNGTQGLTEKLFAWMVVPAGYQTYNGLIKYRHPTLRITVQARRRVSGKMQGSR